jgi:uncharacterized membrane protein AbrB (regulator of aidB expression)
LLPKNIKDIEKNAIINFVIISIVIESISVINKLLYKTGNIPNEEAVNK